MKTITSPNIYQSESVYQTIQNYLNPEMSILVSGFELSVLPFPWIVFKEFTGCFHELDGAYLNKVCRDLNGDFIKESKPVQVSILERGYDLVMYNGFGNTIPLSSLKSYLKPGGLLFFTCDINENYFKETFLEFDFEIIECYENMNSKCFLVKKGWL